MSSLLCQIQAKRELKKASDRELQPKPKEAVHPRLALLNEIASTNRQNLKRVRTPTIQRKSSRGCEDTTQANTVAQILARRMAIAYESSDSSDSDTDEDWD